MADKTYKMTVGLSNGTILDAGTFVAPQGPQGARGATGPTGPQGPAGQQGASGAINDWATATPNDILNDGTYLINIDNNVGIANIVNGNSGGIVFSLWGSAFDTPDFNKGLDILVGKFAEGKFSLYNEIFITPTNGGLTLDGKEPEITNYRYIKLK